MVAILCMIVMAASKHQSENTKSSIPVTVGTRRLVQGQKRAGSTYDRLLREMVKQFDPEEVDDW